LLNVLKVSTSVRAAPAAPREWRAGFPAEIPVTRHAAVLADYAVDSSGLPGAVPLAIARPVGETQIRKLVLWANKHRRALMPVSSPGGPRRRGDTLSPVPAIIVDLSGNRRVLHADGKDRIAIIEPGVTFPELDNHLREHDLRSFKPLLPRASKSVLASYLDREPITTPSEHWDSSDPLSTLNIVFGNGEVFRTGGASIPGTLEENLAKGMRQMVSVGPVATDFTRVIQGSQGALGIAVWGSIYCEPLPALERACFVSSTTLPPLLELAAKACRRRLGGQLFIVNSVQLAMMLVEDRTAFTRLAGDLPNWILFFNHAVIGYFPEERLAYERADFDHDAASVGLTPSAALPGYEADTVGMLLNTPLPGDYKSRALGAYKDYFFLSQLDRTTRFVSIDEPAHWKSVGIYVQPLTQGVNCHVEFTLPHDRSEAASSRASRWRDQAVARCVEQGAFLSRPHAPWGEAAFHADPGIRPYLAEVKQLFDPNGIMGPGRAFFS
jgi:glycolate oxidase